METLCNTEISSQSSNHITGCCRQMAVQAFGTQYLVIDARDEKVRQDGVVRSGEVLFATGVTADGKLSILGVSVSLSEAEVSTDGCSRSLYLRAMLSSLGDGG